MTIKDFLEKLSTMEEGERAVRIRELWPLLSGVSHKTLLTHQNQHYQENAEPNYTKFVKEQVAEVKKCVELEMTRVGQAVRETLGLKPLTFETEIGVCAKIG